MTIRGLKDISAETKLFITRKIDLSDGVHHTRFAMINNYKPRAGAETGGSCTINHINFDVIFVKC